MVRPGAGIACRCPNIYWAPLVNISMQVYDSGNVYLSATRFYKGKTKHNQRT